MQVKFQLELLTAGDPANIGTGGSSSTSGFCCNLILLMQRISLYSRHWFVFLALLLFFEVSWAADQERLRLATFEVSATPPMGSPVAYAPVRKILDPLSARGIVLLGKGDPIVLCAVDWIGIGNEGYTAWLEALAEAAGTHPDRVTVHALHQHDGPRCDFTAERLLARYGLGGQFFDNDFLQRTINRVAEAVKDALQRAKPVTHIGIGKARVERVASNRRLLGPDGKVKLMRYSKSQNPEAIAAPEGVIDPYLKILSFWDDETALAVMSYYATHPQSYYGDGDVTSEFVGLARAQREQETGIFHVHFNGASGNVAAGKYNDGSPAMRPVLTQRMADGMRAAWENTEKESITSSDIEWKTEKVLLPPAKHFTISELRATLQDELKAPRERLSAALHLAWLERVDKGSPITLSCLNVGSASILHMPGELFVEYQLAAQEIRPDR
ncbi:MAG TPA: hypothetical protein VKZ59_08400, partial [Acidobacteriota bacterium]|nr:hypothetical protein [Acidobacteriota bacterium]